MTASFPAAFLWMERLITFAIILQSIEFLQIRRAYSSEGIWSWRTLREEFVTFPKLVRKVLENLLGDRPFFILIIARLLLAIAAPVLESALAWAVLWCTTLLVTVRWRGTFNGGSDYMTLIVLLALAGGRAFGANHPHWIAISLGYVALQTILSFFIAGVAKLRSAKWRNGQALVGFLHSNYYGTPERMRLLPLPAVIFSWIIIGFECLFPIALLNPVLCGSMIGAAIVFQCGNAYAFGLNRFVWAWAAAYPALYWWSQYWSSIT